MSADPLVIAMSSRRSMRQYPTSRRRRQLRQAEGAGVNCPGLPRRKWAGRDSNRLIRPRRWSLKGAKTTLWTRLLTTRSDATFLASRVTTIPLPDGTHRPTDNNRPFLDAWSDHLRAAKIKRPIRWYDLRHTCALSLVSGWWTDAHWTLEMVQAYLGHKSRLSTERYAHLGELAMTQAARDDPPRDLT
jgi:integrase